MKQAPVLSTLCALFGLIIVFLVVLYFPSPLTLKTVPGLPDTNEPEKQVLEKYAKALEQYPDNRLWIEKNLAMYRQPFYKNIKPFNEFCMNAELPRYSIYDAVYCAKSLTQEMRYDDALAIIEAYEKERMATIYGQSFTVPFERWRGTIRLWIAFKLYNNISKKEIESEKSNALSYIYYEQGDYDTALKYSAQNDELLVDIYLKKKEFEKAQEVYSTLRMEQNSPRAFTIRAKIAFEQGDYKTAKKLALAATEKHIYNCGKEYMPSQLILGEIALAQNDKKTALRYFKKVSKDQTWNIKLKKRIEQLEGR